MPQKINMSYYNLNAFDQAILLRGSTDSPTRKCYKSAHTYFEESKSPSADFLREIDLSPPN